MKPNLTGLIALAVLFAGLALARPALAQRQFYSDWKYEEEKKRYIAHYNFKSNPVDAEYKKQTIVHYPSGEKKNYIYFYNYEKKVYWGRCVSRHHPQYDGRVMVWNFASDAPQGKNWGPLSKGDPAIPGCRDGVTMNIPPKVPDPPFAD